MTPTELDPLIHAPKRLAILAILRGSTMVEFQYLKAQLELSDSDLSKQMAALTGAGIVSARKRRAGQSRSTWYRMTAKGRRAFDRHVQTLEALIALSRQFDDEADGDRVGDRRGRADLFDR